MIMKIFREFAQMSILSLNLKKKVLVPLWEAPAAEVKNWLARHMADWTDVAVAGGAPRQGQKELGKGLPDVHDQS